VYVMTGSAEGKAASAAPPHTDERLDPLPEESPLLPGRNKGYMMATGNPGGAGASEIDTRRATCASPW
jgi:hypothetical protein